MVASDASAEDSVTFWGNYYKERSTRVISPAVTIRKDLPKETQLEFTYLIDNITSASGAFTTTDEPFQEFRQEARARVRTEMWDGLINPGFQVRYSYEPDYTSVTYGLNFSSLLNQKNTTLTASIEHQDDAVMARGISLEETLTTWRMAFGVTQLLAPNLSVAVAMDLQLLDGYTENPYRVETHPRDRTRFGIGLSGRYRFLETNTSLVAGYRLYSDSWNISAHTFELQAFQTIAKNLEVIPLFRVHTQTGVDFSSHSERDNVAYATTDPKLRDFGTYSLGLRLRWQLALLDKTPLEVFKKVNLQPSYEFYHQGNSYGDAHIAQLGVCWPF